MDTFTNRISVRQIDGFPKISPEIRLRILQDLDVRTLARFARTSRAHRYVIADMNRMVAHKAIKVFGFDPVKFLDMLKETDSVVAGAVALSTVLRVPLNPDAMDICVPQKQAEKLIAMLRAISQYDGAVPEDYQNTTSAITLWNPENRQITVHITKSPSAIHPLFVAQNTFEMCFISAYGIACAYPALTLDKRGLKNVNAKHEPGTSEWVKGWTAETTLAGWEEFNNHICGQDGSCPLTVRNIHDKFVMFMEFPTRDDHSAEGQACISNSFQSSSTHPNK
jgi:hypothetical protein